MRRVRKKTKSAENHTTAERSGTPSRFPGVLRSMRGIVKVEDESKGIPTSTLTQLRLLFEEGTRLTKSITRLDCLKKRLKL